MHMEERDFTLSCLALPLRASLSLVRSHSLALSQEQLGYCDGQPATLAPRSQVPEGHLVSTPPLCPPCSVTQGQAEGGGMVLVAYAGPVRPEAALRDSVLCLPTDIHSLLVNKPSLSTPG
jgi:hypothetical protein